MLPAKTIPPQTKEMLSLVTDPYHDRNLRVTGFPDGTNITSVIRRLAYQTTVSCPFTLLAGESWDFHIFATPLHQAVAMSSANIPDANTLVLSGGAAQTLNTICIFYRKYNSIGQINAIDFRTLGQAAGVVDSNRDGPGRTVSLGFELHNTTAELYKSGSLTVYRTNALNQRCDLRLTVPNPTCYTATLIQNIPDTLEQLQLIPNARTWEASKGVYSVCLPPKDNPYTTGIFTNIMINVNRTSAPLYVQAPGVGNAATQVPAWSPLNCTGVMSSQFKDANQTFTLDMRQVIEYFPNSCSSVLLPFATTAPEVDRLFLKLYQQMINRIEPGVPVGFNSAGEWFRRIVQLAKEELPGLTHLLPPQYQKYTQAFGPLASKTADMVVDMLTKTPPVPQRVAPPIPPRPKSRPSPRQAPPIPPRPKGSVFQAKAQRFVTANKQ